MSAHNTLLEDLTSGDATRILSAASAVQRSWDQPMLMELAAHIPTIRAKTESLDLGGLLHPNAAHVAAAIDRMAFVRDQQGCLCQLYSTFDDPSREQEMGHVIIRSTVLSEDNYVDHYVCQCQHCGTRHRVSERAYHYTYWTWERE